MLSTFLWGAKVVDYDFVFNDLRRKRFVCFACVLSWLLHRLAILVECFLLVWLPSHCCLILTVCMCFCVGIMSHFLIFSFSAMLSVYFVDIMLLSVWGNKRIKCVCGWLSWITLFQHRYFLGIYISRPCELFVVMSVNIKIHLYVYM